MSEYKVMITGHRPGKIGPLSVQNRVRLALVDILKEKYLQHGDDLVVLTGMALGPDTWVAQICHLYGIRYEAYLPFKDQDKLWSTSDKRIYAELLSYATATHYPATTGVQPFYQLTSQQYLARNRMMVAGCNEAIAVFSGDWRSGTGYTIRRLESAGKPITFIGVLGWNPCFETESKEAQKCLA